MKQYISVDEAATMMKVNRTTIMKYAKNGLLEHRIRRDCVLPIEISTKSLPKLEMFFISKKGKGKKPKHFNAFKNSKVGKLKKAYK